MDAPRQPRWFLSTAPATKAERIAAFAIIGIAVLAFVVTVPFARTPLARVPAFIPAYQSILFICDLITAVLLLGQLVRLRSRSLMALAAGYLFSATTILAHTLSFPGVFAPAGLIGGGDQTTAWLYVFWHGGFAGFVLVYVYFRQLRSDRIAGDVGAAIVMTLSAALALAAAAILLTTAGHDLLPRLIEGSDYSMAVAKGITPAIWLISFVALIALWRREQTVLDLWLMVVMVAWLLDIGLSAIVGSSRFDLGFYAGRTYSLIAASVVLIALLSEMVRLYGHLADALTVAEHRNRELVDSREALAAAQRMEAIGQLTGGIAHDFNNLLTVIGGNLEMIRKDAGNAERVDGLAERAMTAAKRGARLTRQLLIFGGRQTLRPVTLDVSRLIQDFEPLLLRSAEGTQLMTGLSQTVHPIHVDAGQFETALINLIANARDATGGKGRVIIETRNVDIGAAPLGPSQDLAPGAYVVVTVRDTGAGMTAEVAARAVEPFFTTKEPGQGSGLGLSQVYGFVKSAGGHLRLETQPGRGTSVHMYFPKAAQPVADADKPAAAPSPAPPQRARRETVLVVEDDADVREVTIAAVADLGYAVHEAANAGEALEILRVDPAIDLLFSDIVMPGGMTGLELAVEARRIRPGLKVLLTSGNAGAIPPRDGHQRELEILEKPYPHNELATKLRAVMGRG